MTAREAAKALGVNERTIRRAIADGRLEATKAHGAFNVDLEQARASLRRTRNPTVYQEALAETLHLLRAFGHESDAKEVEERHGLLYIAPAPEVYVA